MATERAFRLPELSEAELERLTPAGRQFWAIAQSLANPWNQSQREPEPSKPTFDELWKILHPPIEIPDPVDIVYFIGAGDHVKIGVTTNVEGRLKTLTTAHYLELTVLAIIQNAPGGLEQELHTRFAVHRVRPDREWFRLAPEIQAFIDEINKRKP